MPKPISKLSPILAKEVSIAIEEALFAKDMSQQDLADALGVSFQLVNAWLRKGTMPMVDLWKSIESTVESAVFDVVRETTRGYPSTKNASEETTSG